jgi:hypothetical protein
LRAERLRNLMDLFQNIVADKFYGEVKVKFEGGLVSIVEKIDKIKLDNESYKEYKCNSRLIKN